MNPSVHDRLSSVVRALEGVVLPALPANAALAREQAMLSIGHIQIVLAQLDATPAFEAEEVADIEAMAQAVLGLAAGGKATRAAADALRATLADSAPRPARARLEQVQDGIDAVLIALASDGDPAAQKAVSQQVLALGAARAAKDRAWFAAMGFDAGHS